MLWNAATTLCATDLGPVPSQSIRYDTRYSREKSIRYRYRYFKKYSIRYRYDT